MFHILRSHAAVGCWSNRCASVHDTASDCVGMVSTVELPVRNDYCYEQLISFIMQYDTACSTHEMLVGHYTFLRWWIIFFCTGGFPGPKNKNGVISMGLFVIGVQLKWHSFCAFCMWVLVGAYCLGAMSPKKTPLLVIDVVDRASCWNLSQCLINQSINK